MVMGDEVLRCIDCNRAIRRNASYQVVPAGPLHMTCLNRRSGEFTAADLALLRAVAGEEVSWNKESVRQWKADDEYVLVTAGARRLLKAGLVKKEMAAGYSYIRKGPVVLTQNGRKALRDAQAQPSGESGGGDG